MYVISTIHSSIMNKAYASKNPFGKIFSESQLLYFSWSPKFIILDLIFLFSQSSFVFSEFCPKMTKSLVELLYHLKVANICMYHFSLL